MPPTAAPGSTSDEILTVDLLGEMGPVDLLGSMRRRLLRLLNLVEGRGSQKGESPTSRVLRLREAKKIPRLTAAFMLTVIEARNVAEYDAYQLGSSESAAVVAAWLAIGEWAATQGFGKLD